MGVRGEGVADLSECYLFYYIQDLSEHVQKTREFAHSKFGQFYAGWSEGWDVLYS